MLRVALTGGIATGKSYVLKYLRDAGVPVVDADVLAREVVAPGTQGLAAVVKRFGKDILTPGGFLDRARLAQIVFQDETARRDLESIVHPAVRAALEDFLRSLPSDTRVAVADIPLLYETGRERQFDTVIVVACDAATQIHRVMARDGLSRQDAERRLAAQLPIDEKARRADYVIRTDGSFKETNAQITRVLAALQHV